MEGTGGETVKRPPGSVESQERSVSVSPGAEPRGGNRRSPIALFHALADVRAEETASLLWAGLFMASLLAGNYLIRPVRDEMGIAGGTAHLPAMFAGTLAGVLVVWPLLSTRVGRRAGASSFAGVFRCLQVCLLGFFAIFQTVPSWGQPWAARAFFVWASVTNLLVVSIAWGSLSARFSSEQAHRLFGFIAAGGTVGAIVGSALAGLLAVRAGPHALMLLAAVLLEIGMLAARRLRASPGVFRSDPVGCIDDGTRPEWRPSRELYLTGLGLWTLLFTISSAFVYMEQARIVDAFISSAADRTAFFARIDLLVNLAGLVMQVFLTGRVLGAIGAGGASAMLPIVTLAGCIVLALRPTVGMLEWFQVIRRAVDYAIARPSREVFYTVVTRTELSRTKCLIDTAVYRAGDVVGAWSYGLLAALPGVSFAAPLAIVPLSVVWIALSLGLGRALHARSQSSIALTDGPFVEDQ
jgi:AAA family ATP:ADP antiporter